MKHVSSIVGWVVLAWIVYAMFGPMFGTKELRRYTPANREFLQSYVENSAGAGAPRRLVVDRGASAGPTRGRLVPFATFGEVIGGAHVTWNDVDVTLVPLSGASEGDVTAVVATLEAAGARDVDVEGGEPDGED